jgi:heat shock protein HslJ
LHNKWELDAIDDVAVDATTFPNGMPFLNFNLPNKSISGYDGCNGFGGNFTVMGKRIRFHALGSTLRACIPHATVEFKLQLLSNNLVDYHFEMDKLILYLSDDSRMQYKPVYK